MPKKSANHSKKNWKSDQSNKKSSNQTKLAILVLGLIVLLLILGKLVSFIINLNQPISKNNSVVYRQGTWDGKSNINLVLQGNSVSVLSYNPNDKKIFILEIPNSLLVNVPGGFGQWQIGSVYKLGQSDKNHIGGKLLQQSTSNLLGVPIDGYIVFENKYQQMSPGDLVELLRDGALTSFKILPNINSDLTLQELVGLTTGMSGVRFDKVEDYDLTKHGLLTPDSLPDGSLVYTTDSDRVDTVAPKFNEPVLVSDKSSVAVYNATEVPGLAQKASRIISNLGGDVIISTNSTSSKQKTILFTDQNLTGDPTVKKLAQIFTSDCSSNLKCDIIICTTEDSANPNCKNIDPQVLGSRASINIILGSNIESRF